MSRLLIIVRYAPAVLSGLLVVAWVTSEYVAFGVTIRWPLWADGRGSFDIGCQWGSVFLIQHMQGEAEGPVITFCRATTCSYWQGFADYSIEPLDSYVYIPAIYLVVSMLPGLLALFTRLRFPLWSYFAWTALIAVEMAFYLRTA